MASNSAKKTCAIDKSSIQRVYIGICVELSNSVLVLHGNIQISILGWIPKFILTTCLWVAEGLDFLITIFIPVTGVCTAGI